MEDFRIRHLIFEGARLIGRFVRLHPVAFGIAVASAIVFVSAIVASAVVIGRVTEELLIPTLERGAPPRLLLPALAAIIGVSVWKAIGIVGRRVAAGYLQFRSSIDIRLELLTHQLRLRSAWFDRQTTGELLSISENDTTKSTHALGPLPFATATLVLVAGTTIFLFVIDPVLGLVALAGAAAALVGDFVGMWKTFAVFERVFDLRGRVSAVAHESFDGALTVKALGREEHEGDRLAAASHELRDQFIAAYRVFGTYRGITEALMPITILAVLWIATGRVAGGALTAGELVTTVYLLALLALPIQIFGYLVWDLTESTAAWRRVERILTVDDLVQHGAVPASPLRQGAQVEAAAVGFSYPGSEPVLTDVTFSIRPGRTIAVVGPTAAGKSTVALLLARLWDPDTGQIHLAHRDLRDLAPGALPAELAYVSQDAFLFDDTVAANIRLGLDLSDEEVAAAAEVAGIDQFIRELPDGYATQIGERGTALSGGQRQRIALARAIARRPRLLLLDDATSAVDPSVEARILRRLRQTDLPSTVVVIAYRPSTITLADEVVFVQDGRIVAQGAHQELLRTVPAYAELLRAYEDDAAARREERTA